MSSAAASDSSSAPADGGSDGARRRFLGRLELRQLVARTERSMTWRVVEPHRGASWLIVLPRRQPPDAAALARWLDHARRAARLAHPGLRPPVEVAAEEDWPYLAYESPAGASTLGQRLRDGALDTAAAAALVSDGLEALACAHDAGFVHGDLHPDALWLAPDGQPAWLGLGFGPEPAAALGAMARAAHARDAGRDVAAVGLILRHVLAGRPALDEPAPMQVLDRIGPLGGEALPPLSADGGGNAPAALRAVAERATHRRPRLRYASARTMRHAIDGWRRAEADARHGALALLGERLHRFGALPAPAGGVARYATISPVANDHLHHLAERVAGEPALVLELLRRANLAVGHSGLGGGSVLSPTRALLLLGIDGLRDAALALSRWPGALDDDARAAPLARALALAQRAAGFARALVPAGYDPAVAMVVAQLQRLGGMLLLHHFADEAAQIARLTAPGDADEAAEGPAGPGLDESAAALSVLGVDVDALAQAVLRRWGFDDDVLPLLRPLDRQAPLSQPLARDADAHRLRAAASAANELADAEDLDRPRRRRALEAIELRYGGLLDVDVPRLAELLADRTPVTVSRPWAQPRPDDPDARSAA